MSAMDSSSKKPRVFDSWALLAFLEDEPAAEKVESIIVAALEAEIPLMVTTVNMGEVWYSIARSRSEEDAEHAVKALIALGFEMVEVDWVLGKMAAEFKAKYRLAYADCFSAALATQKETGVITGDQEFRQLADEVEIEWV